MKNVHHLIVAALVASGLAFALPGEAQDSKANLPRADVKFLQKAAQDGLAEVQLGQLAQHKALRDEVRQFAARMVQDHGKTNEQLRSLFCPYGTVLAATVLEGRHVTSYRACGSSHDGRGVKSTAGGQSNNG